MDEELNLDLDTIETNVENKLKVKNRFEQLSEKVILTSKEKDEAQATAKTEAEARIKAEKERDFYKGFSTNVSKYPNASEYQDKIFEKVNLGYDIEDATVAVLAKEGKLNATSERVQQPQAQVEGGSAPTTFEGSKSTNDMKTDEKLDALRELDKTGGLANFLRGGR